MLATIAGTGLPGVALGSAESFNTLSLALGFTPAQNNLFGYSTRAAFDVNNMPAPTAGSLDSYPTDASVILHAPDDIVIANDDSDVSGTTSATLYLNLANLSGGHGVLPSQSYDPQLQGFLFGELDDSAVVPELDYAESTYLVDVFIGGGLIFSHDDTLISTDDEHFLVPLNLPPFVLPADSVTSVIVYLRLSAYASSFSLPGSPPPPPPPPPEPVYPSLPEPATWALLMAGFGLVGSAARHRSATRLAG